MVEQLIKPVRRRRRHTIAATFYLVIALAAAWVGIMSQPSALIGTVLAGAYSAYLFRGGRIVIWIW